MTLFSSLSLHFNCLLQCHQLGAECVHLFGQNARLFAFIFSVESLLLRPLNVLPLETEALTYWQYCGFERRAKKKSPFVHFIYRCYFSFLSTFFPLLTILARLSDWKQFVSCSPYGTNAASHLPTKSQILQDEVRACRICCLSKPVCLKSCIEDTRGAK